MGSKDYSVVITTSGIGSRLGELTKFTNKSLVRVGKRPALSYIIESYPKETPLVVTIRHFGNQVRDFVRLAYPDRNITFSEEASDVPMGESFSLGRTLLHARRFVPGPFIFHAGDTIVTGDIPAPLENWDGGFKHGSTASYRSFNTQNGHVMGLNDKGALEWDYIHIGLVGVKDAGMFWEELERLFKQNPKASELNDCQIIELMLGKGIRFAVKDFAAWYDIGNAESLQNARMQMPDHLSNLDKVDESIFLFDDFVVKFFADTRHVDERVKRAEHLGSLVPKVLGVAGNFYKYEFVPGKLYARAVTPADFGKFLEWSEINLWKPVKEIDDEAFYKVCHDFYFHKTQERVKRLLETNHLIDEENVINGELVPRFGDLLEKLDFQWLCKAEQYQFHGDFILDNIVRTEDGWTLLDWRQNFGGLLQSGDKYYDLAKLNHNLSVNHDMIHAHHFKVSVKDALVTVDILRPDNLVQCQLKLWDFAGEHGYDMKKLKVLTSLIWLNMSPLHHHPFNLFLYYFGKLNLWRALR